MYIIMAPWLIAVSLAALAGGAFAGDLLRKAVPAQRFVLGIVAFLGMVGIVVMAAGFPQDDPFPTGLTIWDHEATMRIVAALGILSGLSIALMQKNRVQLGFALCGSALIGLPLAMNIWMGAGLTYFHNIA